MYSPDKFAGILNITAGELDEFNSHGLIVPFKKDFQDDYYYTDDQIFTGLIIKDLLYRKISSLFIKRYFDTGDLNFIKKGYDETLKAGKINKDKYKRRLEFFDFIYNVKKNNLWENENFEIKTIKARPIVFYRERTPFSMKELSKKFNSVFQIIKDNGLKIIEPFTLITHDDYDNISLDNLDYETAYEVIEGSDNNAPFIKEIPQGEYATGIFKGLREPAMNFFKLSKWIKEKGYKISGPIIRRFILSLSQNQIMDNVIHELQLKVEKQ